MPSCAILASAAALGAHQLGGGGRGKGQEQRDGEGFGHEGGGRYQRGCSIATRYAAAVRVFGLTGKILAR